MRITNRMLANNYLNDMGRNVSNLNTINTQLSTGKEISRASDNPFKTVRSMQLTTSINANSQYKSNIQDTNNYLDTTDDCLNQIGSSLQRMRELMVSAGNAAYGSDESNTINAEIKEIVSEVSQILNTSFDGKYIFGGTKVSSKPVTASENSDGVNELDFIDANGDVIDTSSYDRYEQNQVTSLSSKLGVEISKGVSIEYNVTAMEILKFTSDEGNSVNVLDLFNEIQNNLTSGNTEDLSKVIGENLSALDDTITNVLNIRSKVGAIQNRLESALSKNEDETLNLTSNLSENEDIDFTEKTIEYSMAQTCYEAALQVSAQVLTKSLLDYL